MHNRTLCKTEAGNIAWARTLFHRVKVTMNKLTTLGCNFQDTGSGLDVQQNFLSLAKSMLKYEKNWFSKWSETVEQIAMARLKQPILQKESIQLGNKVIYTELLVLSIPSLLTPHSIRLSRESQRPPRKVENAIGLSATFTQIYHGSYVRHDIWIAWAFKFQRLRSM